MILRNLSNTFSLIMKQKFLMLRNLIIWLNLKSGNKKKRLSAVHAL